MADGILDFNSQANRYVRRAIRHRDARDREFIRQASASIRLNENTSIITAVPAHVLESNLAKSLREGLPKGAAREWNHWVVFLNSGAPLKKKSTSPILKPGNAKYGGFSNDRGSVTSLSSSITSRTASEPRWAGSEDSWPTRSS